MFASASVRINLNEAFSIILYQGYRPVSPNSAAINFIQSETLRRFSHVGFGTTLISLQILVSCTLVLCRWCCVRRNVSWPSHV